MINVHVLSNILCGLVPYIKMYLEYMTLYNIIFYNKCKSITYIMEFQLDYIPRGVEDPVRSVYTNIILCLSKISQYNYATWLQTCWTKKTRLLLQSPFSLFTVFIEQVGNRQQQLSDEKSTTKSLKPSPWSKIETRHINSIIFGSQHLLVSVQCEELLQAHWEKTHWSGSYWPLLAGSINYTNEMILNANEALIHISWDFFQ